MKYSSPPNIDSSGSLSSTTRRSTEAKGEATKEAKPNNAPSSSFVVERASMSCDGDFARGEEFELGGWIENWEEEGERGESVGVESNKKVGARDRS